MKKSVWIKIFSFLMVFCFAFLFTGCAGGMASDSYQNLLDKLENGEISEEDFLDQMKETRMAPLYATKVLYRPEHYDFSQGGGEFSDYFAKYAYFFYQEIIYNFGTLLNEVYKLDAIRNPIKSIDYVTHIITKENGNIVYENDINAVYISANYSQNWNASFNYDMDPVSYIVSSNDSFIEGNTIYRYIQLLNDNFQDNINNYYTNIQNQYLKNLLFKNPLVAEVLPDKDTIAEFIKNDMQSDIVKAIEYVLYCFELDLQPREITFVQGTTAERPVEVRVANFRNIDEALEYIKGVFQRMGSSVGLSQKSRIKLTNWILDTLIGEDALLNDYVIINEGVTRVENYINGATEPIVTYENPIKTTTIDDARGYERSVKELVDIACEQVQIGNIDEDDVNINDRFLASEVRDYWGTTFSVAGEGDQFEGIPAMEYQSAVLMFEEDFELSNLWIAFKYDAGEDGDKIVDPKASITIKVKLNLYKKDGGWQEVATDTIKVPDGEFDYLGATVPDGYTHMARFEGLGPANSEEGIKVGAFNPEIGDSILKAMEYNGRKMISDPIKLVGSTKVKDYYKLIEPEEPLPDGTTYTYGILNHEKFGGTDGCDYLEIAFEVIKIAGDVDTNYKFQAGVAMIA